MSDFNNPNNFDKYGNPVPPSTTPPNTPYEPVPDTGRAPYVLLGILVLIGIIGGALYFNGSGARRGADVANAPTASTTDTRPAPAMPRTPAGPTSTTPAAPTTTPAPAGPPSDTMKQ